MAVRFSYIWNETVIIASPPRERFPALSSYYLEGDRDMKVKPLGDRVLIKMEAMEEKTASGIYIPQTAQEKTQTGVVVAVGDDKDVIKVKVNDKIMYDKYAGTQVKIDGEENLLVKMSDILAIIE
jgi:chaperonin GroES